MSVHLQISQQMKTFFQARQQYQILDEQREQAIENTLNKAKNQLNFDTREINEITKQINEIAKRYNFPIRKLVTNEMILEYLKKLEKQ